MTNKYRKALKHLKNKNIDERLELLEQIPTNNTTGLYTDVPGKEVTPPPVPGLPRAADLAEDGDGAEGYTGNDTTGLFLSDGTILIEEPIGDTSYVLGPMMSMWYAWANYTQIGYVRQSDRKMVNLGRITGEMSAWDGSSGFTSYGQLTLEQAVWYKGQTRADYRAFYPGPPSNPADEYGRYIGSMVSTGKPTSYQPKDQWEPGTQKGFNASDNFSLQIAGKKKGDTQIAGAAGTTPAGGIKALQQAMDAGITGSINYTVNGHRMYGSPAEIINQINTNFPKQVDAGGAGGDTLIAGTRNYSGRSNIPASESPRGPATPIKNYGTDSNPKFMPSGPVSIPTWSPKQVKNNKNKRKTQVAHYEPEGLVLTESRKRIFRDIKKPVQVKEMPTKFKVKPTGRKNKSVGVDMMKIPDTPTQYKPPMNVWGKTDYNANVRASQEKKNEVLELLGAAEHHWTYLTEDKRKQKQEKVNEMMSAEFDKQLEMMYEQHKIKENKTDKVIKYLKDSNLVYDKLDPQSAESMPPTGNPVIDTNIKKATNTKEKARKLKIIGMHQVKEHEGIRPVREVVSEKGLTDT